MGRPLVSQLVLEPIVTAPTASPTTPSTGNVAVSHLVLEPVVAAANTLRVSQIVLEPLVLDDLTSSDPAPGGGSSGTTTFGYAV